MITSGYDVFNGEFVVDVLGHENHYVQCTGNVSSKSICKSKSYSTHILVLGCIVAACIVDTIHHL